MASLVEAHSQTDPGGQFDAFLFRAEFLDSVAEGVLTTDADGTILSMNRTGREMLGLVNEDPAGHSIFDPRVDPVNVNGSPVGVDDHPIMVTLRTAEPCRNVIVGLRVVDGPRCWFSHNTSAVTFEGQIKGVICTFSDITNRLMEEQSLRLLTEVNRFVMFPSDEIDPLQHLCETIVADDYYVLAWIGLAPASKEGAIDIAFSAGLTDYLWPGMASSWESKETGLGPVGTAFRTEMTQVVDDLAVGSLLEPWRERAEEFGLGSCIALPFSPGGRRAVLAIYTQHSFATSTTRVTGLESIVKEVEFGIAHLEAAKNLATAFDGTLNALSQMTERRDPYTSGHQIHVGSLGEAIATQIGLEPSLIKLVRQSGDVHDIGKIGIPAEILTRPGRLSAIEFEIVKTHCIVGAEILAKASLPWPIAEVALQHHERMDGSGYPNGLAGSEIIMPARIIAVADVVEAMTQHRPYRPGLGIDKALAEVSQGAATLFDADVVEACLAVFAAGFTFESSDESGGPLKVD
jgi:PAS domain S-box-containing protein